MLTVDPGRRASLAEVAAHPWLAEQGAAAAAAAGPQAAWPAAATPSGQRSFLFLGGAGGRNAVPSPDSMSQPAHLPALLPARPTRTNRLPHHPCHAMRRHGGGA